MDRLTLRKLYNTEFSRLYEKILKNEDLSDLELEKDIIYWYFSSWIRRYKSSKIGV